MATGGPAESWSEEYVEYPCSVCEEDIKQSDSGHYCLICEGFVCPNCLSCHKKYTTGHQVIVVTDKKFQNVLSDRCVDHPDEVIEQYCGKHDVLLCNTCERLGHRTCNNVKQISDAANELIADQKLQAVPDQLKSTLDRVTQVMDAIDNYVDNVQEKGHTYIKDMDNYERTLIAKIRELTANGRNSITDAQKQLISAANERRKDCEKTKELMSKSLEDLKRSQKHTAHVFILNKKGQGLVNKADHLCRESEDSIKNIPFFYKPDTQIFESLNGFSSLVTEIEQHKIGHRSDINIKISGDKQNCDIRGCGRLSDGTMVLCDYANKRLKCVDPSTNKVTDHFTMKYEPVGLCCISPEELAAGDRVYVSDWDNGLVCMSRDGRVVFRLSNDDMGLRVAHDVTIDHRGSVMVAGWWSHNVVQVTDEGRVVGEILARKDGIWNPVCLYYDVDGRKLYVGGVTSLLLGFELL